MHPEEERHLLALLNEQHMGKNISILRLHKCPSQACHEFFPKPEMVYSYFSHLGIVSNIFEIRKNTSSAAIQTRKLIFLIFWRYGAGN
jgi:hypothetical protein